MLLLRKHGLAWLKVGFRSERRSLTRTERCSGEVTIVVFKTTTVGARRTDAFRKAGRQRRYQDTIMATTLAPCWYCSGLIVQFRIGTVVVGESRTFRGGIDWLRERGVDVSTWIHQNVSACSRHISKRILTFGAKTSASLNDRSNGFYSGIYCAPRPKCPLGNSAG